MDEITLFNLIKDNNIDYIYDLLNLSNKSESTIRRGLKKLEADGFIKLSYGGKIKLIEDSKLSISDAYKNNLLVVSKNKIAKQAVNYIKNGDIIFIDNGTTVRSMFKYINDLDVVIYTNGYNHIKPAQEYNINLKIIPGEVLYKEASIIGEDALSYISDITFDHVFIGANGYDENEGITTPNRSEYLLKQTAIKRAIKAHILIDKTKRGSVSKYKIAELSEVNLITD